MKNHSSTQKNEKALLEKLILKYGRAKLVIISTILIIIIDILIYHFFLR